MTITPGRPTSTPTEPGAQGNAGGRKSQRDRDFPDLDSFPLIAKGNKYEDFEVDQSISHHWGRTLTEGDNVAFSTATCAWLPLHLNVRYAKSQGHPDVVLNPMLVLCTVVGLSVEDLSESGGPFLGIDNCVFHRSVYPGDTIDARSVVTEMRRSDSKPDVGIISWHTTARNQHDQLVIEFTRTNLVAARGGSSSTST